MAIKAAVVQAEPEWLDLQSSVEKTCVMIAEAATNGAKIIAFPELWIPGYPGWIWARPVDFELNIEYTKNSLVVDSEEMRRLCECAAENSIVVCLGFSERSGGSLYIAQCLIGEEGHLLMTRRKLKPVHMERTIFGDANGSSLLNVVPASVGRVGALSCGEHFQPLLKYHTFSQQEEIHVSAWPPVVPFTGGVAPFSMSKEAAEQASRIYSIESQTFTLHSTNIIGERGIEKLRTQQAPIFNIVGGGAAAVFGPDGRKLSNELPGTVEGLVYAYLDFDQILKEKALLDSCGHNSRPDLLWLGVNTDDQKPVRSKHLLD
ncbi:hypothetical protein OIDMADRAFT_139519 [Oidiodendron maius Zn]|uniref:nitrilase n=1 Tax=Oidiodendron maius (strain Zn) TaxID=913774 RepID=A0A0C3C119_OIDMZ|nr:hypothetical protein OIDMADRAFT_139519 [Oidiodendron maius Zn]